MPTSIEHRRLDANNILVQRSPPSITRYLVPGISYPQFLTRYGTYHSVPKYKGKYWSVCDLRSVCGLRKFCWVGKHASIIYSETDELPNPRPQPNPNKNWVKSGILGHFFPHSKIIFRGLGFDLM